MTIHNWGKAEKLRLTRYGVRSVCVLKTDLEKFIESRKIVLD